MLVFRPGALLRRHTFGHLPNGVQTPQSNEHVKTDQQMLLLEMFS